MKITKASVQIEYDIDGIELLKRIEKAGRTCYKSEEKVSENSYVKFIGLIIKNGHESVLEHEKVTVRIVCDRGVTHEIVRHRMGSYSQESTRYCNYGNDTFGNEICVIEPLFWAKDTASYRLWYESMCSAEKSYLALLENGATPQEARSVLPNSLKTEIVVTYNLREWRHFLRLRTASSAHPQMREVALMCLNELKNAIPVIFNEI